MGFVNPVHEGMIESLGVSLDARKNVAANVVDYRTSVPKVYCGWRHAARQSLVVWAIREGRQAAHAIDKDLVGTTTLPR